MKFVDFFHAKLWCTTSEDGNTNTPLLQAVYYLVHGNGLNCADCRQAASAAANLVAFAPLKLVRLISGSRKHFIFYHIILYCKPDAVTWVDLLWLLGKLQMRGEATPRPMSGIALDARNLPEAQLSRKLLGTFPNDLPKRDIQTTWGEFLIREWRIDNSIAMWSQFPELFILIINFLVGTRQQIDQTNTVDVGRCWIKSCNVSFPKMNRRLERSKLLSVRRRNSLQAPRHMTGQLLCNVYQTTERRLSIVTWRRFSAGATLTQQRFSLETTSSRYRLDIY